MNPRSRVNRVHARRGRPIRRTSSLDPCNTYMARAELTLGDFVIQNGHLKLEPAGMMPTAWSTTSTQPRSTAPAALGKAPSTLTSENDNPLDLSLSNFPPLRPQDQVMSPPMTEMPIEANLTLLQALQKEEEFLNEHFPNRKKRLVKASDIWDSEQPRILQGQERLIQRPSLGAHICGTGGSVAASR
ncbi:hypothetical protein QAD02_014881 [Eretmocerus hayati]|uniref:Uncharacterized protein n=1 Tax=Eretmocerus hayati TaxID=131215 RepID=A0ACC2P737_9HYME|nr:hypothetical protein QAD02_014881 [Eretmocerus hayati]